MKDFNKLMKTTNLTELEQNILKYFTENIEEVQSLGVRGLAKETFSSPSTIIRLSKKLGFAGYSDMYYSLLPMIKQEKSTAVNQDSHFLQTTIPSLMTNYSEEKVITFVEHTLGLKNKYIFIYATGFSQITAEYFYKKLLVLGHKTVVSSGMDSAGIFENNLDDIGAMIVISKSGETEQVYDKLQIAKEADIYTISFTGNTANRISAASDLALHITDLHPSDDKNMLSNVFFPGVLFAFEAIIDYYLTS